MIAAWDFLSLFANILLTLLLSHPDAAVLLVHTLSRHICPAHVHPNTLSSCAQQEHLSMAKSTPRTEPLPLFNCLVTLWILHPLLKVFFGFQTVRSVLCKSFPRTVGHSLQPKVFSRSISCSAEKRLFRSRTRACPILLPASIESGTLKFKNESEWRWITTRRQLLTDLSEESLNVFFFSLSYRLEAILLGLITFLVCLVCFITV